MGSWRMLGVGFAIIVIVAITGSVVASANVVVPPLVAAAVVLLAAALAVDYFGFARRHAVWHGRVVPTSTAQARATVLAGRFRRQRARGSVRTGASARALLISLAEIDRLRDADEIVDFLATEACIRVGGDVVADALRALALGELGRLPEARRVLGQLGERVAMLPVVAFARARVAELEGKPRDAIVEVDRALPPPGAVRPSPAQRDLALVKARQLARLGRGEDARALLTWLAERGHRDAVETTAMEGASPVALAARAALELGTVYR